MCLALISPPAPKINAHWIDVPQWVPVVPLVHNRDAPELAYVRPFGADAAAKTRELYSAFCTQAKDRQAYVRLIMKRLSHVAEKPIVDAAIDLGIALEALYLSDQSDDRGELTFRLKIKAARFLATDAAERKKIFDLIGRLYAIRSSAVHTGKVPPKSNARSVRLLLNEGVAFAVETVRRFIILGEPDWSTVLFG
jgi:hypothetical protein